jgi:hypothetical protein
MMRLNRTKCKLRYDHPIPKWIDSFDTPSHRVINDFPRVQQPVGIQGTLDAPHNTNRVGAKFLCKVFFLAKSNTMLTLINSLDAA